MDLDDFLFPTADVPAATLTDAAMAPISGISSLCLIEMSKPLGVNAAPGSLLRPWLLPFSNFEGQALTPRAIEGEDDCL